MALTQIDRELIERCLTRQQDAWEAFVVRFAGLFVQVVRHTAECRSYPLNRADLDEISAEIMSVIIANDFKVLRNFRGRSSLATYLAVVARRIAVNEIIERRKQTVSDTVEEAKTVDNHLEVEHRDQLEHLLGSLSKNEARIVRAFHLDGKSYREISSQFGIPENSIGPVLSRAKEYMRRVASPH